MVELLRYDIKASPDSYINVLKQTVLNETEVILNRWVEDREYEIYAIYGDEHSIYGIYAKNTGTLYMYLNQDELPEPKPTLKLVKKEEI